MKYISIMTAAALLTSCAANPSQQSTASTSTTTRRTDPEDQPPFNGMTKAQAVARYGQPKQQTITDEGEQWTYWLNFGQVVAKHMIPFFFSTEQVRIGILIFGPDGKVKKFRWDVPKED